MNQLHEKLKLLDELDLLDLLQIDSSMLVEAFLDLIENNYDYIEEQLQTTQSTPEEE